jgi:hypothetical protein
MSISTEVKYDKSDTADIVRMALKPTGTAVERVGRIINSPSMLVRCPRATVLSAMGTESDLETESKARGTSLHYALQREHFLVENEMAYEAIVCHIDLILNVPVEIFTTMIGADATPSAFPLKAAQLMTYIYVGYKMGYFLKTDGDLLIFHMFPRGQKPKLESIRLHPTIEQLEKNFANVKYNRQQLKRWYDSGDIPDMNPTQTPEFWECRKCPHYNFCYTDIVTIGDVSVI